MTRLASLCHGKVEKSSTSIHSFGSRPLVRHFKVFFGKLAHLATPATREAADMHRTRAVPRPQIAEDKDAGQKVGHAECQALPRFRGQNPGDGRSNQQKNRA